MDMRGIMRGVTTVHMATRLLAAVITGGIKSPEDEAETGIPSFAIIRAEEARAHGIAALEGAPVHGRLSWC